MIRRFLLARRIKEPGCGRCGYPVHGLPGWTCPECGGDLKVVGTLQPMPSRARELLTLAAVAAWLVVMLALARVGNAFLLSFVPGDVTNHRAYELRSKSAQYPHVAVVRVGYGWGWPTDPWVPRAPTRSVMRLNRPAPNNEFFAAEFDVDQHGRFSYAVTRAPSRPGTRAASVAPSQQVVDGQAVLEFLKTMEVDAARDDVRKEAAELAGLLIAPDFAAARHEGLAGFTVVSVTGGVESRGSQPILVTLWLVVAAAGAAVIVRSRRRRDGPPRRASGAAGGMLSAST